MKIHQLHSLIDWLNKNHNAQLKKLPLNKDNLENSSWFSGFVDSDGSFSVQYTKTEQGAKKRKISCRLRIEQRMLDPITNDSYYDILNQICLFLNCKLRTRTKHQDYYIVCASNEISLRIILNYFNRYPLFSTKYLDYKDWETVVNFKLSRTYHNEEISELILKLKAGMNTKRTYFNWDHLKSLKPTPGFLNLGGLKKTAPQATARKNLHFKFSKHTRTFTTTASVFKSRSDSANYPIITNLHPFLKSVKIYKNADVDKLLIIKENISKAGVYRWINLTNGKSYVGSSSNLGRRFREYFSISFLEIETKKGRSKICNALVKYGYSGFSLEILEYCDPEKAVVREQYFLDLISPEYNILLKAGSSQGHLHSSETKVKMSQAWTLERKAKHLERLNRLNSSKEQQEHLKRLKLSRKGCSKPEGSGIPSVHLEVVDTKTQEKFVYTSITEAARAIGFTKQGISTAFKRKKEGDFVYVKKKRYILKKIN